MILKPSHMIPTLAWSCSILNQMSDDALSPSYLTQVTGSTFD